MSVFISGKQTWRENFSIYFHQNRNEDRGQKGARKGFLKYFGEKRPKIKNSTIFLKFGLEIALIVP